MDQKELIDKIAKEVMQRLTEKSLNKGAADQGNTQPNSTTTQMSKTELAGYIDHTLLKPEAVETQFEQLFAEALK